MKYIKNEVASLYTSESLLPSITRLCLLIKDHPFILKPVRGKNEKVEAVFCKEGFQLYPTVKNTTLFYDKTTNCFFKILHHMSLKNKLFSLFTNKASSIYNLSEDLQSKGVRTPRVMAYGIFKKGEKPFFAIKKLDGKSLYEILIKKQKLLPKALCLEIVDEIAEFHRLGYWFRDAHLSHIFVKDSSLSGFIDIDGIRNNRPFSLRRLAKDLAGLNHPHLPIAEDEKKILLNRYMDKLNIKKKEKFLQLLKSYTERRWKKVEISNPFTKVMQETGDKVFNVLHVISRLPVGGVENMLLKVIEGYNKRKFNATVCCIKEGGVIAEKLRRLGYKVEILNKMKGHGFDIGAVMALIKVIKRENIHILRTHQYHASLYGRIAGILARVPVMVPSFHSYYMSPSKPKLHRSLINHLLSFFSDILVAVSNSVASDIIKYDRVNPRKIKVIYNGTAINKFSLDISKEEARKTLGIPLSSLIIGTVGRLRKEKGHRLLIESASQLNDTSVAIAGDGPLRGELESLARRFKIKCIFMGQLNPEDIPLFLKSLDIFCFPSLWEGFGIALVEAMAAGLPIIASDIPPHREVLGDAGILTPKGDIEKLAEALKILIDNSSLRDQLGHKAGERAKLFSIENTVRAYEGLFEKTLNEKKLL